jgi:hypothetical protein
LQDYFFPAPLLKESFHHSRQDWRNTDAVGTVTSGALCAIDCFAADEIAVQRGNFDKSPARSGLSLNAVSREPVDVGDQSLHFGAVRRAAAQVYGVDPDAVALKVKREFAAKEKAKRATKEASKPAAKAKRAFN